MVLTERIRSLAKLATGVISAHTVLLVMYNYAHEKIDLFYVLTAYMPILLLFCLVPLTAVFVLSTQFARQGAVVLLGILPAALIYNIVTRFISSPPVTPQEPALIWIIMYEGSFGFVLIFEAIAFWLSLKLLQEIYHQLSTPLDHSSKKE